MGYEYAEWWDEIGDEMYEKPEKKRWVIKWWSDSLGEAGDSEFTYLFSYTEEEAKEDFLFMVENGAKDIMPDAVIESIEEDYDWH